MQRNTSHPVRPLVSCLMVTQKGRFEEIQQSTHCFIRQHLEPIELVIVHDSGSAFHMKLINLANEYPEAKIRIHHEPKGHTLGWLRNRSIQHANGELVCQWDDDDLNHPSRLKIQYDLMCDEETDFCFMTDQLHLFTEQSFLFWDDRGLRQPPFDLIENTMLGKRSLIANYPDLSRGEDTAVLKYLFQQQVKISRLRGKGWLYTYVYNGKNTWDFTHHAQISLHQRLDTKQLLANEDVLRAELPRYQFAFGHLYMPHREGKIELKFQAP